MKYSNKFFSEIFNEALNSEEQAFLLPPEVKGLFNISYRKCEGYFGLRTKKVSDTEYNHQDKTPIYDITSILKGETPRLIPVTSKEWEKTEFYNEKLLYLAARDTFGEGEKSDASKPLSVKVNGVDKVLYPFDKSTGTFTTTEPITVNDFMFFIAGNFSENIRRAYNVALKDVNANGEAYASDSKGENLFIDMDRRKKALKSMLGLPFGASEQELSGEFFKNVAIALYLGYYQAFGIEGKTDSNSQLNKPIFQRPFINKFMDSSYEEVVNNPQYAADLKTDGIIGVIGAGLIKTNGVNDTGFGMLSTLKYDIEKYIHTTGTDLSKQRSETSYDLRSLENDRTRTVGIANADIYDAGAYSIDKETENKENEFSFIQELENNTKKFQNEFSSWSDINTKESVLAQVLLINLISASRNKILLATSVGLSGIYLPYYKSQKTVGKRTAEERIEKTIAVNESNKDNLSEEEIKKIYGILRDSESSPFDYKSYYEGFNLCNSKLRDSSGSRMDMGGFLRTFTGKNTLSKDLNASIFKDYVMPTFAVATTIPESRLIEILVEYISKYDEGKKFLKNLHILAENNTSRTSNKSVINAKFINFLNLHKSPLTEALARMCYDFQNIFQEAKALRIKETTKKFNNKK